MTIGHRRWQSVVTPALTFEYEDAAGNAPGLSAQDISTIPDLIYREIRQAVAIGVGVEGAIGGEAEILLLPPVRDAIAVRVAVLANAEGPPVVRLGGLKEGVQVVRLDEVAARRSVRGNRNRVGHLITAAHG
jgi:hypothetical protein